MQLYADRAFISVQGARIADVQSAQLRQNHNRKPVPTMTRDGHNAGVVKGNKEIDITLTIAVQNGLGRPKLEAVDYDNQDVQLTFIVGSDLYTANGLYLKDNDDNAGGVGDEVRATFNFGALRLLDGEGNSTLFDISL